MITQRIRTELEGMHFTALQAFADRLNIKTTSEVIRRVIETTSEYQALVSAHTSGQQSAPG